MPIETKKMSVAVIYGVGSIFAIAMIASLIVSILLRFTSLTESSLTYVVMIVSFLSLFIGGFISGGKGKKQGLFLGGSTGLLYLLVVFLFQYLGHDSLFTIKQWIYYGCFVITAMMGGVLGVNMSSDSRSD
ncbi:hypothetical protein AM233_22460 [Bacillus sp. FJAT-22058]|nr:hypothetical protein AM233_22460 [Bacillus sp. FJAT-22058]